MADAYIPFGGASIEPLGASDSPSLAPDPLDGGSVNPDFLGGIGSGNDGGDGFDPDIHVGRDKLNADGSYRRKRGRRGGGQPGSNQRKNSPRSNNQAGVESLTRILAIVHTGIAGVTKCPEMNLEDDEAKALSAATVNVLDQFDIRPDPKIEAIIGLVTCAGMIYGPRVYMIRERKKIEAKAKKEAYQ